MSEHKHRFKAEVRIRKVCKCGAEGEPCEACGKWFDLNDMRTDAEGYYFCADCAPTLGVRRQVRAPGADKDSKEGGHGT